MAEPKDTEENMSDKQEKPEVREESAVVVQSNKPIIIAIVISSAVAFVLCIAVALLALTALHRPVQMVGRADGPGLRQDVQRSNPGDMNGSTRERLFGMRDEGNSSTRISGVITSVSGDSFVIAGNGKTVNVTKTSSTTIRGTSTSIAVNDSVMISGTQNDDTFTATTITVRNITTN